MKKGYLFKISGVFVCKDIKSLLSNIVWLQAKLWLNIEIVNFYVNTKEIMWI